MDRSKIDGLFTALKELDDEIINGIQKPVFNLRGAEWQSRLPGIKDDSEVVVERLREARVLLNNVDARAQRTITAILNVDAMHQEMYGRVVPLTLGAAIARIVDEHLATKGDEPVLVDGVQKGLSAMGVRMAVKNPPAVISSILARDGRLEKVDTGTFKKKG